jgi:hypothetical protein
LRSQILAVDRIATDQPFLDRVGSEACGIVRIFVSTGDGHDPLRQQHLVMDFDRLPLVFETSRKCCGISQPPVSGREQDRSATRAALPLVKLRGYWPIKYFRKEKTLCCSMFAHAKASFWSQDRVDNGLVPRRGFSRLPIRELSRLGEHLILKSVVYRLTRLDRAAGDEVAHDDNPTGHKAHRWLLVEHLLSYAILACGLLTVAVGAYQILSSHSPVPIWDEWQEIDAVATAPHHQPPVSWLWTQHNEHRVLFYRLLLLADIHLFHANHWISFLSMLGVQCAFLALLVYLLHFGGVPGTLWRACAGLGAFCLLCPSQWENFGWAFQISFLLPGFFLILALLGLLRYERSVQQARPSWICLGLSILAASAATYSIANGVVVWPVLLFVAAVLRLRFRVLAVYAASGFAVIGSYLYHYVSPSYRLSPWQSIRHPLAIMEYTAKYMGVVLPPWMRIRDLLAVSSGAFGLLAALAAAAWVLSRPRWRKPFPLALLGLMFFSLATAFLTALGRVGLGTDQVFSSRYQTTNLLFWFSVVSLWLLIADEIIPSLRAVMLVSIPVVMLAAAGLLFPLCLRASRLITLRSEAAALTLISGVPDKQALTVLYPDPWIPWRDAEYFRQQHLFMFSGSWYGHMDEPLASVYRAGSQERCAGQVSMVEPVPPEDSLTGKDSGGLRISGWAVDRLSENPILSLVIAAHGRIVGFGVGGLQRKTSGSKVFLTKAKFVEWKGSVRPPPGTTSMDVYAVETRGDGLCHLATVAVPGP